MKRHPRTKHTAGRNHHPRCLAKKIDGGNACNCGQYGKKNIHISRRLMRDVELLIWRFNDTDKKFEYVRNSHAIKYLNRCLKWRKHEQIRRIDKFKEKLGL